MSWLDKLDIWINRHPKIPKIVGAILKKIIDVRDKKIYLESAQLTLSAIGMCFTFRSLIGVNPAVKYWDICDNVERYWEDSFKHDVEIDAIHDTLDKLESLEYVECIPYDEETNRDEYYIILKDYPHTIQQLNLEYRRLPDVHVPN